MPATTTGTVNVVGGTAYVNTTTTGGETITGSCTRILEVDDRGIVVGWQWEGGNCPFLEAFGYAEWRRKTKK
jgi:hypothetical protein